jgi:sarcosine oxidase subunit alpha
MSDLLSVQVNGKTIEVAKGTSAAVAALIAGAPARISVAGEPRTPLCGMGICFECRMIINGIPHSRSCQILVEPDMDIRTDE